MDDQEEKPLGPHPQQITGISPILSRQHFFSPDVQPQIDRFPSPATYQKARPLIGEACAALRYQGSEPEEFWRQRLDHYGWWKEDNFLSASIVQCAEMAKYMIGSEGRDADISTLVRVAGALLEIQREEIQSKEHVDRSIFDAAEIDAGNSARKEQTGPPMPIPENNETQNAERRKVRDSWVTTRLAGQPLKFITDHPEGPSDNTLRRYRSGAPSTQDGSVRGQLAKVFDCQVDEVPR